MRNFWNRWAKWESFSKLDRKILFLHENSWISGEEALPLPPPLSAPNLAINVKSLPIWKFKMPEVFMLTFTEKIALTWQIFSRSSIVKTLTWPSIVILSTGTLIFFETNFISIRIDIELFFWSYNHFFGYGS